MDKIEETSELLKLIEETNLPEDGKNLRSKIDSIMRTIENLSAKKLRLELEIKQQKRVLSRKRQELRRRSKSNTTKLKVAIESAQGDLAMPEDKQKIFKLDQMLLRESAKILEE